jgi:hypothetical protein
MALSWLHLPQQVEACIIAYLQIKSIFANQDVFEGKYPCVSSLEEGFRDELHLWRLAGAKNLTAMFDPG